MKTIEEIQQELSLELQRNLKKLMSKRKSIPDEVVIKEIFKGILNKAMPERNIHIKVTATPEEVARGEYKINISEEVERLVWIGTIDDTLKDITYDKII